MAPLVLVELTDQPIDVGRIHAWAISPECGATVVFLGTSRQWTGNHETLTLVYDCYRPMAEQELRRLTDEALSRWPIARLALVHRLGEVPLGEASIAVIVSSAHREAAFLAAQWLVDEVKRTVPIWKQDHGSNGAVTWSHPRTLMTARQSTDDERQTRTLPIESEHVG